MSERYWLVHANGGRQLIDPGQFDLSNLAEQARRVGGTLVIESVAARLPGTFGPTDLASRPFEPPISALGRLFCKRFDREAPRLQGDVRR